MLSRKTIEKLMLMANKIARYKINKNVSIGWYEDDRKEAVYTKKCYDGDYPLTKGLREGNKALINSCFVPIKINNEIVIREVRFHDASIAELLSGELGFINFTTQKGIYLKLRTPICKSIEECIKYTENALREKHEKKRNHIIQICQKNNMIFKKGNLYYLSDDMKIIIEKWCKTFKHFEKECEIFCNNFYSKDGFELNYKSAINYFEIERKKNEFNEKSEKIEENRKKEIIWSKRQSEYAIEKNLELIKSGQMVIKKEKKNEKYEKLMNKKGSRP